MKRSIFVGLVIAAGMAGAWNPDGRLTVVLYNTGRTRLVSCTGAGTLLEAWVSQDGLLSRAAQVEDQSVLLPNDSAATLVFK